jgi:hypothetical protein
MELSSNDIELYLIKDSTSAYIIRVWIEYREIEGATVVWRGFIEHVASGRTQYLTDLNEITRFIRPFLEAMGVDFVESAK